MLTLVKLLINLISKGIRKELDLTKLKRNVWKEMKQKQRNKCNVAWTLRK